MKYLLDDLVIDTGQQSISRSGVTIKMPKLSYELFLVLIRAAPNLVSLEDLIRQVWPAVVVSSETVTKRVTLVREALGEDSRATRYIVGLRGRGYRIAVDVSIASDSATASPSIGETSVEANGSGAAPESEILHANSNARVGEVDSLSMLRSAMRNTGRFLGVAMIGALVAGAGFVGYREWRPASASAAADPSPRQRLSIAVLPFLDLSENGDQRFFADGMSEELIDLLANMPDMMVIDRTSSFQFRGKDQNLSSIAQQLGVTYVLEGSVRRSGERMRITAQLIDPQNGLHRWSSTFDRDSTDTFQVQDEISQGVARALQLSLGIDDFKMLDRPTTNPAAHSAYLKGRLAMDRVDRESLEMAAAYTQQARDLDPAYASALVSLSEIRLLQAEWAFLPMADAYDDARALAELAIERAPQIGQAHAILAEIYTIRDWDWTKAQIEFERAVALGAHDSGTLLVGARLAAALGRWSDAGQFASAAKAVDPLSPMVQNAVGSVFYRMGRNEEAIKAFHSALTISPSFNMAHFNLAKAELAAGHQQAALTAATAEVADVANNGRNAGIAMAQFALGHRKESDTALEALKAEAADSWPFGIAQVYGFRGEVDQAFRWLNRAYDLKDEIVRARGDPVFNSIEHDPRFETFLQRLHLPLHCGLEHPSGCEARFSALPR